jgi:hypothetical protein
MECSCIFSLIFLIISISLTSAQFSVYDQTIIPFSIYNADGNPNNIITNSKTFFILNILYNQNIKKRAFFI